MVRKIIREIHHHKQRGVLMLYHLPRPMPLHRELDKKLSKVFEPSTRIDDVFKGYDITFVTNEHGEPVVLFFGKRRPDGIIAGERYTRTIKRQPGSLDVKSSHWDLQGKIRR